MSAPRETNLPRWLEIALTSVLLVAISVAAVVWVVGSRLLLPAVAVLAVVGVLAMAGVL